MVDAIIWLGIFLASLVGLVLAADYFIKTSERIGLALGIPAFIVGVTLVALGTSLPELITSILAVLESESMSTIVLGNVIGSNITNICLVLGIVGILGRKISLQFDLMRLDMPMFLASALMLYLFVQNGTFTLLEGCLCLLGLGLYLLFVLRNNRNQFTEESEDKPRLSWREPLILVTSGTIIYFSADYNVLSIGKLAEIFQVGKSFIALTMVSLGTSIPELVVSIVCVRSGNGEMAVGNVLGSNVFNIFAVMGIPRLFGPILIAPEIQAFSLPAMLIASLLFFLILVDKILMRWEGWGLFLSYLLFLGLLIARQV